MSAPRLSIIMPVFNHPDKAIEMIGSIRANRFSDWELIAIDDGSSEECFKQISDYTADDKRIHYERRTKVPKGAQTCRNIGFEKSQGEYICFFDSDDLVTETCLEQRVNEMDSHPDLDFMVFRSSIYGKAKPEMKDCASIFGYPIYDDDIKAFCSRTLPFVVWNNIYRRASLVKYGIMWDTRLLSLQDAQFNLQTLLAGMKYAYSGTPACYAYRISTTDSVSKRIHSKEHFDSNIYAVESFYEQVQDRFGHRYDKDLYEGAMMVNLMVAREQFSMDFSKRLSKTIREHSRWYGILFFIQIYITRFLMAFLPYRIARRIPMFSYLSRYRKHQWKWIPEKLGKFMSIMLLFLTFPILGSCQASISDRDSMYELSWQDDFNKDTLDTGIWTKMRRVGGSRSIGNLTDDDRMYELKNGRIRLYARYNNGLQPNDTARFLTGGITSERKKTFTYGKIEVRVKFHGAIGTWPAIWTMPDDRHFWKNPNPLYTEIDILEYVDRNRFVYQTAHNAYTLADKKNWHRPEQQNLSRIKRKDYNTYSVEILPDMLIFGVNGKETFRYPKVDGIENQFPYGIESHIMMDMQVYPPTFWSGGLEPETFPAYMDIDWIRVYKLKQ